MVPRPQLLDVSQMKGDVIDVTTGNHHCLALVSTEASEVRRTDPRFYPTFVKFSDLLNTTHEVQQVSDPKALYQPT